MSKNPLTQAVTRALNVPGISPAGGAWLAKALHPSDATLKCMGIPEDTSLPTAALNFMTTQVISAPAAAQWSAHVKLAPTPLYFGRTATDTAAAYGYHTAYNPTLAIGPYQEFGALGGNFHLEMIQSFAAKAHAYRLMYASVTATLTASSTTNEGSVVAAQYDERPLTGMSVCNFDLTSGTTGYYITKNIDYWTTEQYTAQQLQTLPGAVSWDAKQGVYLVLKLDEKAMNWHSTHKSRAPICGYDEPSTKID